MKKNINTQKRVSVSFHQALQSSKSVSVSGKSAQGTAKKIFSEVRKDRQRKAK